VNHGTFTQSSKAYHTMWYIYKGKAQKQMCNCCNCAVQLSTFAFTRGGTCVRGTWYVHVRSIPPGEYGITPEATFFTSHLNHLLIFQKWQRSKLHTFCANTPNRATLFLGAPMKSKCVHCFLGLFFQMAPRHLELTPPTDLTNQPV
jgi:hypothetical protein